MTSVQMQYIYLSSPCPNLVFCILQPTICGSIHPNIIYNITMCSELIILQMTDWTTGSIIPMDKRDQTDECWVREGRVYIVQAWQGRDLLDGGKRWRGSMFIDLFYTLMFSEAEANTQFATTYVCMYTLSHTSSPRDSLVLKEEKKGSLLIWVYEISIIVRGRAVYSTLFEMSSL